MPTHIPRDDYNVNNVLRRAREQREEMRRQQRQMYYAAQGTTPPHAQAPTPEPAFEETATGNTRTTELTEAGINEFITQAQRAATLRRANPQPPPRVYTDSTWSRIGYIRYTDQNTTLNVNVKDEGLDMSKMHKLGKWDEQPSEITQRSDWGAGGTLLEKIFYSPSFFKELLHAIHTNTNRVSIFVSEEFPNLPNADIIPRDYFDRCMSSRKAGENPTVQNVFKGPITTPIKELLLGENASWGGFAFTSTRSTLTVNYDFAEVQKLNVPTSVKHKWVQFYESINKYYEAQKNNNTKKKIDLTVTEALRIFFVYQYQRTYNNRLTVDNLLRSDQIRNAYQQVTIYPKYTDRQSATAYRYFKLHFLDVLPKASRKIGARAVFSNYNTRKQDFVVFLKVLYGIRYKRPMPENRVFYAWSRQTVQWGGDGVIDLGTHDGLLNLIPQSWVDRHLYFKCLCCENYRMYENRVIFNPTITKKSSAELETFIKHFTPENILTRVSRRQEEYKKSQAYLDSLNKKKVEGSTKKPSEPYPVDDEKDSPLFFRIKKTLNTYIKGWKGRERKLKSTDLVCEFGINHSEKDRQEIARPESSYDTGHSQSTFSIYSPPLCINCNERIYKVYQPQMLRVDVDGEDDEDFNTILNRIRPTTAPRPTLRGPVLQPGETIVATPQVNWGGGGSNIQNYSANPMDTYLGFRLGKNENKTMGLDTVMKIDLKTNKLVEHKIPRDKTLYMGVELEVTPNNQVQDVLLQHCNVYKQDYNLRYKSSQSLAAQIMRQYHSLVQSFIVKSDATTANGFEIVSVPGTHKWHVEEAWKGFFKEDYTDEEQVKLAPSSWLCGWPNNGRPTKDPLYTHVFGPNRPICGIHVHVSRDALSPLQLGKILFFVGNPYNKGFIEKIAGRNSQKYANILTKKLKDGNVLIKMKKNDAGNRPTIGAAPHGDTKYQAINTNTGKPTIEFRIFRSNVTKYGFFKVLDFVHALVTWCANNSSNTNDLTVEKFVQWVDTNRGVYKYLTSWLVKNKYLTNIHTFNPKFSREFELEDSDDATGEREVA